MSRHDGKVTQKQEGHVARAAVAALRRLDPGYDRLQAAISNGQRMDGLNSGADRLMAEFLGEVPVAPASSRIWTPSRTIQNGTVKDEKAMRAALKAAGRQIGSWASDILPHVRYSRVRQSVNLAFVSNEGLGLTDEWVPLEATHAAGLRQGLELCEWEDGPQLAAQYGDQPYNEVIRMAMPPIVDSYGYPYLFYVGRDGIGLWLDGHYGNPANQCHRHAMFAFRCK